MRQPGYGFEDLLRLEADKRAQVAAVVQRYRDEYMERNHGRMNLEVLKEIDDWGKKLYFGLDEIKRKKNALETSGFDPELKKELLKIFDTQEKVASGNLDTIVTAMREQMIRGEEPPGYVS